ncbi:hypothetical protein SCG7109_AV_00090 [Chlamydiales bacterium SCGC AG-110-M15]|nr:hypothetical protein SCG7109_AV_00090 [Chlamydiales bacterium SCGC AG-110-M15]
MSMSVSLAVPPPSAPPPTYEAATDERLEGEPVRLGEERLERQAQKPLPSVDLALVKKGLVIERKGSIPECTNDKLVQKTDYLWNKMTSAISTRCLKQFEEAIIEHADEGIQATKLGKTLLHFACELEVPEIVSRLVDLGLNPCLETPEGLNALHIAALHGNTQVIRVMLPFFIQSQIGLDIPDKKGNTALHLAANAGKYDAISLLIKGGANLSLLNHDQVIPLHLAVKNGHLEAIKALPATVLVKVRGGGEEGVDTVNRSYPSGYNAIHLAAKDGKLDALIQLIAKGGDINRLTDTRPPYLPIELALQGDHQGCVAFLLSRGAIVKGICFSSWGLKSTITAELEKRGAIPTAMPAMPQTCVLL